MWSIEKSRQESRTVAAHHPYAGLQAGLALLSYLAAFGLALWLGVLGGVLGETRLTGDVSFSGGFQLWGLTVVLVLVTALAALWQLRHYVQCDHCGTQWKWEPVAE